jgi:hypothetical protein
MIADAVEISAIVPKNMAAEWLAQMGETDEKHPAE